MARTDPKNIRINDAEDPDRSEKFRQALERTAIDGNAVVRKLIDAFLVYVATHGHGPAFPVDIVPRKTPRKKRAP